MTTLKSLFFPEVIDTSSNDIIHEFFIPALSCSTRYDRGVGYFSSGWLQITAKGIVEFAKNSGSLLSSRLLAKISKCLLLAVPALRAILALDSVTMPVLSVCTSLFVSCILLAFGRFHMPICLRCDTTNPDGATFCARCGASLVNQRPGAGTAPLPPVGQAAYPPQQVWVAPPPVQGPVQQYPPAQMQGPVQQAPYPQYTPPPTHPWRVYKDRSPLSLPERP